MEDRAEMELPASGRVHRPSHEAVASHCLHDATWMWTCPVDGQPVRYIAEVCSMDDDVPGTTGETQLVIFPYCCHLAPPPSIRPGDHICEADLLPTQTTYMRIVGT